MRRSPWYFRDEYHNFKGGTFVSLEKFGRANFLNFQDRQGQMDCEQIGDETYDQFTRLGLKPGESIQIEQVTPMRVKVSRGGVI